MLMERRDDYKRIKKRIFLLLGLARA